MKEDVEELELVSGTESQIFMCVSFFLPSSPFPDSSRNIKSIWGWNTLFWLNWDSGSRQETKTKRKGDRDLQDKNIHFNIYRFESSRKHVTLRMRTVQARARALN